MIYSAFTLQKRSKTEPDNTIVGTPFNNPSISNDQKTQISQVYKTIQLMNQSPRINIKYSQIKIVLAINSIFNLISKHRSTKIQKYTLILFQNLSNYKRATNAQNYEIQCHRQLQYFQGMSKLLINTVQIKKEYLFNVRHQLVMKRKLSKVFNRIDNQIYQSKLMVILKLLQQSKKDRSLLDNLSYYYCKKQVTHQENMAIKFASSTQIATAINKIVLKHQIRFFIKLIKSNKLQQSIKQIQLGESLPFNNRKVVVGEFELVERKLNSICLLNSVIKKKLQNYFFSLKLQDVNNSKRKVSIKSSLLNSSSSVLRKFMRQGESIIELYSSTNDTEQSKKDYEQEEIVLNKKKTLCQTQHPESLIKKRISIIHLSQKNDFNRKQSLELKTTKISKQKSIFQLIVPIFLIVGVLAIFIMFQ
ncbi:unnamed protein product [Paramecium octaurelia]|uniref:Transmembrane protein n=1 Tax=Paramecium octaurelia TaxID=43137 RepID=A0A8S1VY19_PAROT|nr:unnamed protein product [Paramecium octaurelia]